MILLPVPCRSLSRGKTASTLPAPAVLEGPERGNEIVSANEITAIERDNAVEVGLTPSKSFDEAIEGPSAQHVTPQHRQPSS